MKYHKRHKHNIKIKNIPIKTYIKMVDKCLAFVDVLQSLQKEHQCIGKKHSFTLIHPVFTYY